jgi:PadR family transcriptional regulator, regulatory protein PadR
VRYHRRQRTRNRRRLDDGTWEVRARVERFGEPGLLLLLADGPTHGYELLERLPAVVGQERVDVGNVYRELRALEEEGLVVSEWRGDLPGPAKRTYTLTEAGVAVLTSWLDSLEELRDDLTDFVERARKGGDHVRTTPPSNVDAANA